MISNVRVRKHYRAAQREIEQSENKGLLIPEDKKLLVLLGIVTVILGAFVKGLFFGYLAGKRNRDI